LIIEIRRWGAIVLSVACFGWASPLIETPAGAEPSSRPAQPIVRGVRVE